MIKIGLSLLFVFLLSACVSPSGLNMSQYYDEGAIPSDFVYCYGYGCSQKIRLGLHDYEWKQVKNIFREKSKDAITERQKIAKAVALIEKMTGALAHTSDDLPKAPITKESDYELDCIDETVNTTKYLTFFERENLLQFHNAGKPAFKGLFIGGGYPHNTATIIEKETGQIYVVDSYIFANGKMPVIVSYEYWLDHREFDEEKF